MTVSNDFSYLNSLRPANAVFGEVVSLELFVDGLYDQVSDQVRSSIIGRSKRKSIHVPPSSNAYWNFMNLRADFVRAASAVGMCREDRKAVVRLLNLSVRHIHYFELCQTYRLEEPKQGWSEFGVLEGETTQYYQIHLSKDVFGWTASFKGLIMLEGAFEGSHSEWVFDDIGPILR